MKTGKSRTKTDAVAKPAKAMVKIKEWQRTLILLFLLGLGIGVLVYFETRVANPTL